MNPIHKKGAYFYKKRISSPLSFLIFFVLVGSDLLTQLLNTDQSSAATINESLVSQLLTHVPDSIIDFNHRNEMPAIQENIGVILFADISGFSFSYFFTDETLQTTKTEMFSVHAIF